MTTATATNATATVNDTGRYSYDSRGLADAD
jgi:hypothetical protein